MSRVPRCDPLPAPPVGANTGPFETGALRFGAGRRLRKVG
jgi:hypothetical protein